VGPLFSRPIALFRALCFVELLNFILLVNRRNMGNASSNDGDQLYQASNDGHHQQHDEEDHCEPSVVTTGSPRSTINSVASLSSANIVSSVTTTALFSSPPSTPSSSSQITGTPSATSHGRRPSISRGMMDIPPRGDNRFLV
jgi:hypothetical protein